MAATAGSHGRNHVQDKRLMPGFKPTERLAPFFMMGRMPLTTAAAGTRASNGDPDGPEDLLGRGSIRARYSVCHPTRLRTHPSGLW
jgi:hypothetical protein